jgi:hypothetical protein
MDARLLYIRENEINSNLSTILNSVERSEFKFFILVEITPIHDESMPMINGVKEIRINKVKEKIIDWFKENLSSEINFELSVFEGKPSKDNPPVTLKGINKLFVFVDSTNDIRIVPFLKAQLEPEKIVFFSVNQLINYQ